MKNYLDNLIKNDFKREIEYELFAINIRNRSNYGHQIYKIVKYISEINDAEYKKFNKNKREKLILIFYFLKVFRQYFNHF